MSGKKISKKTRTLIVGFAAIVVLGGVLALLLLTGQDQDVASSEATSSTAPKLIDKAVEDIKAIDVTNATGSYSIAQKGEDYTISTFSEKGSTEVKTVTAKTVFSTSAIGVLPNSLATVTYKTVEGGAENLALYGLDKPKTTLKMNFSDGTSFSLSIGNDAPDATNSYVYNPQTKEVCLVSKSSLTSAEKNKESYVDKTLFPVADEQKPFVVKNIDFGGSFRPEAIALEVKPEDASSSASILGSTYLMTAPRSKVASNSTMNDLFSNLWGVSAAETITLNPTPEQLTETGLAEPYSTITIQYDDAQLEVKLGNKTENGYYCQTSNNDAIFMVDPANVGWAEYTAYDFYEKFAIIPNILTVSAVTVEFDGKAYRFDIKKDTEDALTITCDGKDIPEDAFKKFYQNMIAALGENPATEVPASAAVMKYTYEYLDKSKPNDVLEFKPINDRLTGLVVNGQIDFSIRSKYVDKIKSDLPKTLAGEEVSTNW